jgi:hypothetical protein
MERQDAKSAKKISTGFMTFSRRRNKDIKDDQDKRTPGFILKILDILVSYSFRPV